MHPLSPGHDIGQSWLGIDTPTIAISSRTSHESLFDAARSDGTGTTENSTSTSAGSHPLEQNADQDLLEPIAIVGMGMKFPGDATTPESFWKMLYEGRDANTDFPQDRLNIDAFHSVDSKRIDKITTRRAHFIQEDVRAFDAQFFNTPPVEAGAMDPQHRGLLEATYKALENAGMPMNKIAGTDTSVHIGCFTTDFTTMQWRDPESIPKYSATGGAASILSNKLSWFYDLRGASMTIDTACSSGMVAVELACNGLWSGKSKMAIAGGANLILSPELNIVLSNMNFLSKDGRCFSFDQRANGYARGEGFGVLVLKPVSQAIKDGDTIRALIRSAGTNQDGFTSGGITQPSQSMQAELIRQTYRKAGLDMGVTRFFEAHGTGTPIGDPLEARAIGECFRHHRCQDEPMYVGAVKSNIGHLEGASGLAGIIKTVLALEKGVIPPNCNFETLNPSIDADFLNLSFPSKSLPWPTQGIRRASINSFGFGGANAHVVLDDAYNYLRARNLLGKHATVSTPPALLTMTETEEADPASIIPRMLTLSAADEDSLNRMIESYGAHFTNPSLPISSDLLSDLAHTLNTRRSYLAWRSSAVINSTLSMRAMKDVFTKPVKSVSEKRNLGFVFTGQGAQWFAMGRELLICPVFKESLLRARAYLYNLGCEWSLSDELCQPKSASRINEADRSQPICTAIQIAMVDLLDSLDVRPNVVLGHSSGEIAAAYTAGHLSHFSAMAVAYHRGKLASELVASTTQKCTMASVGLSHDEVTAHLQDIANSEGPSFDASRVTVSCINSPINVTLSGPLSEIDTLVNHFQNQEVFAHKLNVGVGYHSPQMEEIASRYKESISSLQRGTPRGEVQMMSSVTCKLVTSESTCSSDYWVKNMVSPVRFAEAMRVVNQRTSKDTVVKKLDRSHLQEVVTHGWIEIGPHSALQGPIRDILKPLSRSNEVTYVSALVRHKSALDTILAAVGILHCHNFSVDLSMANKLSTIAEIQPKVLSDLPEYPFNHSTIHWEESHKSKAFRFRQHAPHPLLGVQVDDWNPLEAKWSFIIRGSEIPWIQDHKINGSLLYPAAGMLVMAIEAVKLLTEDKPAVGFEIKEASFHTPLIVSMTEPTETQITLSAVTAAASKTSTGFKFKLHVRKSANVWEEICRCDVQADYGRAISDVDNGLEANLESQRLTNLHDELDQTCMQSFDEVKMYHSLKNELDMEYGPSFRALKAVRYNDNNEAVAFVKPFTWIEANVAEVEAAKKQVVHPTTLDALFHVVFVALSHGMSQSMPTMVPRRIGRLWLSAAGIGNSRVDEGHVVVRSERLSKRSACSDLSVLCRASKELRVQLQEFEITAVSNNHQQSALASGPKQICHFPQYRVDLDTLNEAETTSYCEEIRTSEAEPIQWYRDIELLTLSFAAQALRYLEKLNIEPAPQHQKYVMELRRQLELDSATTGQAARSKRERLLLSATHLAVLKEKMSTTKRGQLYTKMGHHLTQILLGEVDALQLLFGDQILLSEFYYEMNTCSQAFDLTARYLDALVHKRPNLKFLEIGAGTGATTSTILDILDQSINTARFDEYVFTDISPSFFDEAQTKFNSHKNKMKYRVLDVEKNPLSQEFKAEEYDVVIATNVLHATKNLFETMRNARAILKPGGKLILMEMTVTDVNRTGFVFGLLPGWWLSEDFRAVTQRGPCASEAEWDNVLRSSGFSGADHVFRDFSSDECHTWSVIVTTALSEAVDVSLILSPGRCVTECAASSDRIIEPASNTFLIYNKTSPIQKSLACQLSQDLGAVYGSIQSIDLIEIDLTADVQAFNYIVLHELEQAILNDLDETSFKIVQKILTSSKSVVWVSSGGGHSPQSANHGIIRGLGRVARGENHTANIVTIALEESSSQSQHAVHIAKVFNSTQASLTSGEYEPEYLEIDGRLHINRIVEAAEVNDHIFERTSQPVQMQEFGSGLPLRLHVRTPGLMDSLEFVEDDIYYEPLQPNEVEIQVCAIGVNFKECLAVLGRVDLDVLGSECAGIVTRLGSSNTELKIGDRVLGVSLNTYKSYVRARQNQVVKIPDWMTFVDAGGIPAAFCTAYYSLIEVARLRKNQTVLIHAATGGTGQANVQIAQWIGAEIYATVGSQTKKKLLMEKYNIPDDHIFYSRDTSFAQGIKRMTKGRGVDVIVNCLSGEALVASWECIGPYGHFVEIGRKDIDSRGFLPMHPFIRNVSFSGVDLAMIIEDSENPLGINMMRSIMELMEQGHLRPAYPLHVYPLSKIEHAFRFLQSGQSSGKIIIEVKQDAIVPVVAGSKSNYSFDPRASYVIAGGLGGIGRSTARWMARRGAKNLLLLSRSGPSNNSQALQLISELNAQGVRVECPKCDIADQASLTQALEEYKDMPPIKGCMQASMVLRDATFASMEYNDWTQSVRPKIQGSWNLHEVLPKGMDFFVFFSSVCGIFGNGGQANYAAGNTYQDALAEYRRSQGEKATALDLGIILGEGFVAENTQIMDHLLRLGILLPIAQNDLFAMLDYYCDPARELAGEFQSQVVTGLELQSNTLARGQDIAHNMRRPLFRCMAQIAGRNQASKSGGDQAVDFKAAFIDAATSADAGAVVGEALRLKLSRVMGIPVEDISLENRIDSYGVDSLVAVELRNWLAREWSADVAVFDILGGATPLSVGGNIANKSAFKQSRWIEA